jgi:hypothetical protein
MTEQAEKESQIDASIPEAHWFWCINEETLVL